MGFRPLAAFTYVPHRLDHFAKLDFADTIHDGLCPFELNHTECAKGRDALFGQSDKLGSFVVGIVEQAHKAVFFQVVNDPLYGLSCQPHLAKREGAQRLSFAVF